MIEHVWRRACAAGAAEVLVATDDPRIAEACRAFGAEAVLTDIAHASGTDRLAEVARVRGWPDDAIVVNVQGDEPLLPPANVAQVAALLAAAPGAAIATLATPIRSVAEFLDPNAVKVVATGDGRALYFSRAPIPWPRDSAPDGLHSQREYGRALRHVGLYAYRCGSLARLAALPVSPLEEAERLEQLRALENGLEIRVAVALEAPGPGVDTPDDLATVEAMLAGER